MAKNRSTPDRLTARDRLAMVIIVRQEPLAAQLSKPASYTFDKDRFSPAERNV